MLRSRGSGTIRLLLENGANDKVEGEIYCNALSAASYEGHESVVQISLEKRANENIEDGRNRGSALLAASYRVTREWCDCCWKISQRQCRRWTF